MDYTAYFGANWADYTDEQLVEVRNFLEFENGRIIEEWSEDLAKNTTENLDPYSFWGARKIKKINSRHTHKTADILNLMDEVENELIKRDRLKYNKMFDGKKGDYSKISEKEFFEKEELKTLKYKQKLKD